jgi:hypothetical protein
MKVALMASPAWVSREASNMRRLIVGLTNEQVRVVPVVGQADGERYLSLVTDHVAYEPAIWSWMDRFYAGRLAEQLRGQEVDLVHVLDGKAAPLGSAVSHKLGVPVVCSCWSTGDLTRHKAGRSHEPAAYLVPTEPLASLARQQLGPAPQIELVRPGVFVPSDIDTSSLAEPGSSLCCLVILEGAADEHFSVLLEAVASLRQTMPQLMLFLYAPNTNPRRFWQAARRLDLLDQVNLVGSEPGTRQLLVQVDLVLRPQPTGRVYGIGLEAMGAGCPVIGVADPIIDYLIDGQTARILDQPTADRWARELARAVDQPESLRRIGQAARAHIQQNHTVSQYVSGILHVYRSVSGAPLPFSGSS